MNSSLFLRFINRSRNFYVNTKHFNRTRVIHIQNISRMSTSTSLSLSQTKLKESFQDELSCIMDSLLSSPRFAGAPDVTKWIRKVFEYNLMGGKKMRGLTTVMSYEMVDKPENITEETMRRARTMGWCVEMLQAYWLVLDDIMDSSSTRRGAPCWYRVPEVGLGAINDALLIYTCMLEVLRQNFEKLPQYTAIINLFGETGLLTSVGQHLDYTMAQRNKNDFSLFTVEQHEAIVTHKTAHYTYRLPVHLGMLLANVTDQGVLQKAQDICLEIGKLFQIQDDYIDCYSDESVSGKVGTDIQEGKCSWLAVKALERFTPVQRALFQQFYGSSHAGHVQKIKWLYDSVQIPQIYMEEERARYEKIVKQAHEFGNETGLSPKLFLTLVELLYNRKR